MDSSFNSHCAKNQDKPFKEELTIPHKASLQIKEQKDEKHCTIYGILIVCSAVKGERIRSILEKRKTYYDRARVLDPVIVDMVDKPGVINFKAELEVSHGLRSDYVDFKRLKDQAASRAWEGLKQELLEVLTEIKIAPSKQEDADIEALTREVYARDFLD
ncbi:hypothetical protein KJ969_03360 [Patescibacteria group bacterium]|nr:hypothetical protein [Patescibacteria group bacterium]MBU1922412.1 hypothetical protein [Patescibacteria group bacterium]